MSRLFQYSPALHDLREIIMDGDKVEDAKAVVDVHPDILEESRSKIESVLHSAATHGRVEIIRYLLPLASNELLIEQSKEGCAITRCTCLFRAVEFRHVAVARLILQELLHRGLPIDIPNEDGDGLMRVTQGNVDMLRLFQEVYPELLERPDEYGETAIHHDARYIESLQYLLSLHPEWIRLPDSDGSMPIHHALSTADGLPSVKYLVSLDPELLNVVTSDGWTLLHHAAMACCSESNPTPEDTCIYLLQTGTQDVDAVDVHQLTPFQVIDKYRAFHPRPVIRQLLAACSSSPSNKLEMKLGESEIYAIRHRVYFDVMLISQLLAALD